MPQQWFAAKRYGYGWYPSTKEGYAVMFLYMIFLLTPIPLLPWLGVDEQSGILFTVLFMPYAILLTALLLWICVKKGEKVRWRWGG